MWISTLKFPQPSFMLAGELWELKSMQLKAAKIEKHQFTEWISKIWQAVYFWDKRNI